MAITMAVNERYDAAYLVSGATPVKGFDIEYVDYAGVEGKTVADIFVDQFHNLTYDLIDWPITNYLMGKPARDMGKPVIVRAIPSHLPYVVQPAAGADGEPGQGHSWPTGPTRWTACSPTIGRRWKASQDRRDRRFRAGRSIRPPGCEASSNTTTALICEGKRSTTMRTSPTQCPASREHSRVRTGTGSRRPRAS